MLHHIMSAPLSRDPRLSLENTAAGRFQIRAADELTSFDWLDEFVDKPKPSA
jgi:hypothetical protein